MKKDEFLETRLNQMIDKFRCEERLALYEIEKLEKKIKRKREELFTFIKLYQKTARRIIKGQDERLQP